MVSILTTALPKPNTSQSHEAHSCCRWCSQWWRATSNSNERQVKATCLDRHLFRAHCSSTLLSQTYTLTWKLVTPWNIQGVVVKGPNKIPFIPEGLCISQVMNVFAALLDMEVLQKLRSHFAGWFMDPCKNHIYTDLSMCVCGLWL